MDLRQLRNFVAVIEHGNMLRAAEKINVTQPALSKSIRNLENQLGVQLLKRSPRGVSPTPYGRQLLDRAKLILNQTKKAEDDLRALVEGVRGHLNIGFGANFAGFLVPQAILKVITERPGVTANIISKPYDELLPMLRQGELDMAIVVFPPERPDDELVYEPLIVSEMGCTCRLQHPLVGRGPVSVAELARHNWVLFDRPQATETIFLSLFVERDVAPPRPVISTSSMFFLKAALRQGDYLSYIPPGLVYDDLANGSLVTLQTDLPTLRTTAGIVYRASDILPAAVIDELRRVRDRLGASDAPRKAAAAL